LVLLNTLALFLVSGFVVFACSIEGIIVVIINNSACYLQLPLYAWSFLLWD